MKRYDADLVITDQKTGDKMEIHLFSHGGKTASSAINNIRKEINKSLLETVHKLEMTEGNSEE